MWHASAFQQYLAEVEAVHSAVEICEERDQQPIRQHVAHACIDEHAGQQGANGEALPFFDDPLGEGFGVGADVDERPARPGSRGDRNGQYGPRQQRPRLPATRLEPVCAFQKSGDPLQASRSVLNLILNLSSFLIKHR